MKVLIGVLVLWTTVAAAQNYPTHPVRVIVPYGPGGVDLQVRAMAPTLSRILGQQVVIENKEGGGAVIGTNAVKNSTPDGYTILFTGTSALAVVPHMRKNVGYTADDFVAIGNATGTPLLIAVRADAPYKTLKELVAYAKANPGKLSYSTGGVGGPQHLAGELMNKMAGIDVLHVPYRGSAPAVTDVATGAVTMSISSLAVALPLMDDGKIRAIAVTSKERMPQLPDVAPLREGAPSLNDYELLNWFGMFAPAGTPAPILTRLNAISNKALAGETLANKLKAQGIVPKPGKLFDPETVCSCCFMCGLL